MCATCTGRQRTIFVVWQTRFISPGFSARLIECRQANWFEINLSVSPHFSACRFTRCSQHYVLFIDAQSPSQTRAYFVSKRENHTILRKMSSRRKMATVNCMFAPKHKCTWKFQKWISLSHAACYPNVIELYSHSHTPQRERILMLGSPPHELTPLCCTRKRRS